MTVWTRARSTAHLWLAVAVHLVEHTCRRACAGTNADRWDRARKGVAHRLKQAAACFRDACFKDKTRTVFEQPPPPIAHQGHTRPARRLQPDKPTLQLCELAGDHPRGPLLRSSGGSQLQLCQGSHRESRRRTRRSTTTMRMTLSGLGRGGGRCTEASPPTAAPCSGGVDEETDGGPCVCTRDDASRSASCMLAQGGSRAASGTQAGMPSAHTRVSLLISPSRTFCSTTSSGVSSLISDALTWYRRLRAGEAALESAMPAGIPRASRSELSAACVSSNSRSIAVSSCCARAVARSAASRRSLSILDCVRARVADACHAQHTRHP